MRFTWYTYRTALTRLNHEFYGTAWKMIEEGKDPSDYLFRYTNDIQHRSILERLDRERPKIPPRFVREIYMIHLARKYPYGQ